MMTENLSSRNKYFQINSEVFDILNLDFSLYLVFILLKFISLTN